MAAARRDENRAETERRWNTRLPVDGTTELTLRVGDQSFVCRLEDISLGGARLRLDAGATVGSRVELHHASVGRLTGRIAWRSDTALGIAFDLPERELERALQCILLTLRPDR